MENPNYEYEVQDNLLQKQIDGQTSINAPQMMEAIDQHKAVLVEQTDPKRVIKEIMLILQGKEEQYDGTYKQVAEPKMNQVGLEAMWYWLKTHINQSIILSHFEEKEINKFMEELQDDLVDELGLCWKIYGIKTKTDLDVINDSILMNIKAALNRAKGQNEKNWLGRISVENISGTSRPMPKRSEGFLSKFRL